MPAEAANREVFVPWVSEFRVHGVQASGFQGLCSGTHLGAHLDRRCMIKVVVQVWAMAL